MEGLDVSELERAAARRPVGPRRSHSETVPGVAGLEGEGLERDEKRPRTSAGVGVGVGGRPFWSGEEAVVSSDDEDEEDEEDDDDDDDEDDDQAGEDDEEDEDEVDDPLEIFGHR